MRKIFILGARIDLTSYDEASALVIEWAGKGESRFVCAANVHMVMEAYDAPDFQQIVNTADLVTPDGMPLVWAMRLLGAKKQQRVYGPDLTLHVARTAATRGIPIGLYGGTSLAVQKLAERLCQSYPSSQIVYCYSPPFRPLTEEEDAAVVAAINASGARILLVGLGCPKQERWMAAHKGRVHAVMLGVGAAFDIHAGLKPQAPAWMQRNGLEWLFRLKAEPRRLWARYFFYNPRFLILMARQLLKGKR